MQREVERLGDALYPVLVELCRADVRAGEESGPARRLTRSDIVHRQGLLAVTMAQEHIDGDRPS